MQLCKFFVSCSLLATRPIISPTVASYQPLARCADEGSHLQSWHTNFGRSCIKKTCLV